MEYREPFHLGAYRNGIEKPSATNATGCGPVHDSRRNVGQTGAALARQIANAARLRSRVVVSVFPAQRPHARNRSQYGVHYQAQALLGRHAMPLIMQTSQSRSKQRVVGVSEIPNTVYMALHRGR